jgi:hypothetical protein
MAGRSRLTTERRSPIAARRRPSAAFYWGSHALRVEDKVGGNDMRAEKAFMVPAGGTCEVTVTLS